MSISDSLAQNLLGALKNDLDGGYLFVFAGPVPADPDDALDMDTLHTQLLKLTVGNDGFTGLTFDAPIGNVLPKAAEEVWEGLVEFDGAQAGESTLSPTFYRFCATGDDGRVAAGTTRVQGTVGGPASAAGLKFDTDTVTANGSNTKGVGIYSITADQVG